MWNYEIQALGVAGASALKKIDAPLFNRFEKIYIHNEGDRGSETFIKKACEVLPYEKLYTIRANAVDNECKDPSDLHIKGILDFEKLLATAEKVDKKIYEDANIKASSMKSIDSNQTEQVSKHVKVAEDVMKQLEVRYYKGNYFTYRNGVYKENLELLEHKMLEVNNNLTKNERQEVLDYIRIKQWREAIDINEDYINFKNGIFDLKNNVLIQHSPEIFTVCQLNAEYIEDDKLVPNPDVDKFLNDITCGNADRKTALLQIIGYCMTYRVDFQKAFLFYGPSAKNGKSTAIEIIDAIIGKNNICHITVHQLLKRFTLAELENKLLNTETEIATELITNMEVFKKIITGDEISVERKYKDRHITKPFAKFIFATNDLPVVENTGDEGYYRRLNILLFEKQFTREEELEFDKSKLLTTDALNYLANISLREYIKIIATRTLANEKESEKIIEQYRENSNTVKQFIEDDLVMKRLFEADNKIPKTYFFDEYLRWCGTYNVTPVKKKYFYKQVLKMPGYSTCKLNGQEFFVNLNEKDRRTKDRERLIF